MADSADERTPLKQVPATPEEVLELVRRLSADLRRVDDERRVIRDHLGQAITLGHDHLGYSWVDLARAAEFAHGVVAQQWALPLVGEVEIEVEGVKVAEAALRLGVARETVYAWVKSGQLTSTVDPSGRIRVILPPSA
jgi:excisionase family DNA binding protein